MAGLTDQPPRVTAIIIFFNEAKYLEEAIQSVITQTLSDWELLLCDDGSTDASTKIAKKFAEQDKRIHYLEHNGHANKGMSATRNLGLSQARGSEIAFLDGDDVWTPDKLEKQTQILDQHPESAMTFGPLLEWHTWSPNGGKDKYYCVASDGRHPFENKTVQPPDMLELFLREEQFIPSGVLFRHDAYKQVGGFESQFPASYEDAVFHVKMCAAFPVYVHAEHNYQYRIHPESCERKATDQQIRERELRYLEWAQDYLVKIGSSQSSAAQACRDAIWRNRHPNLQRLRELPHTLLDLLEQVVIKIGRLLLPQSTRDRLWMLRNQFRR